MAQSAILAISQLVGNQNVYRLVNSGESAVHNYVNSMYKQESKKGKGKGLKVAKTVLSIADAGLAFWKGSQGFRK